MSKLKKRAFVRYTRQGKIVPGSLIVTNGKYPAGPAKWQEVPMSLCCLPEDCCTPPPVVCNCYLLVNPSLTETLHYSYMPCGSQEGPGGVPLDAGQFTIVCANTDSVVLSGGLLMEAIADCSPEIACLTPPTPCVTYYISNNTPSDIVIDYLPCGGTEVVTVELPSLANTTICAQLGSVSAPGATINGTALGCPA